LPTEKFEKAATLPKKSTFRFLLVEPHALTQFWDLD